ncbi:hypothetical protein DL96DRAFT_1113737 [Flagelloscypha sp. PMI_526]|nr:hypothetical protein DL96DRAFT_1113737 [Flagelloscypha sp. PMI_526]
MGGYQRSRSLPPPIPTSQASNISSQSSHPALPSLPSNISPGLMAVAVPISYAQTFLPPGTVNSDGSSYTWMVLPAGGSICPSQVQSDPVTKPRRASPVDRNRDDPEELMLFATDTCLSYFNCERFEHQKPELRVLMAKMRRLAEPLRLKQEDDRIIIRRRRNDILFHDLNRFVDGMVPLLADFVFHCPPFIFELPRRLRNQVLHVFDGPQNEPWVASVREYFRR